MNTQWKWANGRLILAAGVALSFVLTSCNDDETPPVQTQNILEIASSTPTFSTLATAVETAGLEEALAADGPITVFAPNNDAFNSFLTNQGITAEELLANPDLDGILAYHVVSGSAPAADIEPGAVETLSEQNFYVSVDPQGGIWINGKSRVTQADVAASNGIIHVIDYVITPPRQSIAEIAVDASEAETPQFTQLVAALTRANLVDAVSGDATDNLTVFAPTDAAFEALYEALGVSGIDEIPLETLTDVLLYHVVPARAFSQDLRQDATLPTLLEGQTLTVDLANLQINESGLIQESLNIHGVNGVIHAIDQVLLPAADE
ncbi:MAG: fasciclin [Algoriphagus sp. 32-45-6]|nr:MAG: fasciclin [Algoriphagus sp. 32-45-6]